MEVNESKVAPEIEEKARPSSPQKKIKLKSKSGKWIVIFSTIGALIIFRLFLPTILLNYLNKKLAETEEYRGEIKDIDLALIRGAYVVKDLRVDKIETSNGKSGPAGTIPFFSAPRVDLSVEWGALLKGVLVGEIYLEKPVLNFVNLEGKKEYSKSDTADFRKMIKSLMPLTVNRFEITQGEIHYIDPKVKPAINLALTGVDAIATNLSNVNEGDKLPAHLDATGNAYGGDFEMQMNFDGLNKVPTFDLNAELTAMNLVKLNDFFKAYGNFEIEKGSFGLYIELAAKEGNYGGYAKPVIKDIKVKQGEGDLKDQVWELIVGGASKILTNPSKDQIATKLEIKGNFDASASVNLWRAVSFVLQNAFVKALKPAIDNSININKLEENKKRTFLEKIFGGGKKTDEMKNEEKKERGKNDGEKK